MAAPASSAGTSKAKDGHGTSDGIAFYGYLYDSADPIPKPTPVFDALLRAIALRIIQECGDKSEGFLTPRKLATFYRDGGCDFDAFFVRVSPLSISNTYRVQGCRHLLLSDDDYVAPQVPALTINGFVRWEAIQVLLDPDIHVPLIQDAVRKWDLVHPDTGVPFPPDLPRDTLPLETDAKTELWHNACGSHIYQQATPKDSPKPPQRQPNFMERKIPPTFAHVRVGKAPSPSRGDYFNPRTVAYSHVPSGQYSARAAASTRASEQLNREQREHDRDRYPRRPESPRWRRSFSDNPSPRDHDPRSLHVPSPMPERRIPASRRHSQPRHVSVSSETEDESLSPRLATESAGRRRNTPLDPARRMVSRGGERLGLERSTPETPPVGGHVGGGRSGIRNEHSRTKGFFELDIREKLSNLIGTSSERKRSGSRGRKNGHSRWHSRDAPGLRLSRSWSDNESDVARSDIDTGNKPRSLRDRERARERDRNEFIVRNVERLRSRDRDRDHHRNSDGRHERIRARDRGMMDDQPCRTPRERISDDEVSPRVRKGSGPYLQRPEVPRRTSSHADMDRRRDRDLGMRGSKPRDERRRHEGRSIPRGRERRGESPIVMGVDGRKYPAPTW